MALEFIDLAIIATYAVALFLIANLVSREKAGHVKSAEDYFLAGKALPWWAVGASLIAANRLSVSRAKAMWWAWRSPPMSGRLPSSC